MIFFYSLLFSLLTLANISDIEAKVNESHNKIYLRELTTIPEFNTTRNILEKNIYDVIFESKKYDLYFLDSKGKNSVFISNYERLTVDVSDQEVKVTLSDKVVVKRRLKGIESPVLDLRLALYELFFGKDHIDKNMSKLISRSMSRMKTIKKVASKQEQITMNESTKNELKAVESLEIKNPSPKLNNKDKNEKSNHLGGGVISSKSISTNKIDPITESLKDLKSDINNDTEVKKSAETNLLKNEPLPIKDMSKLPVKGIKTTPVFEAERKFLLTTTAGVVNYKAEYSELATTTTTLNFYAMAIIAQSRLSKEFQGDSFFSQFDYELSLQLFQPKKIDQFEAPKGRKIFASLMSPHYKEGLAGGIFLSHENSQLITLRDINQGLELVDINFIYAGPELHFDFSKGNYLFNIIARYKYGLMANSDFKADYNSNATAFESRVSAFKHWGMNLKFEKSAISSSRKLSTGKATTDLLEIAISYKFN